MAVSSEISQFSHVELLERVDDVPAGSRGAVLEFHDDGTVAMLEILEPDLGPAERIIFAPLSQLRRLDSPTPSTATHTHSTHRFVLRSAGSRFESPIRCAAEGDPPAKARALQALVRGCPEMSADVPMGLVARRGETAQ